MALGIIGILCVIAYFGYKHYSKIQRGKYGEMVTEITHPGSFNENDK